MPVGESYLGAAYLVGVQSVITQLSEFTGFIVNPLILPDPLVGEGFPPRFAREACASRERMTESISVSRLRTWRGSGT